ncbi:HEAT repeat domain-containing protein [Methanotrichaceae archaeon M04Ac]|uniref:HEAT repeat domain-containing protein n=1 Tax=Candidatus Methanocrinis alkalitolerans TaxID=3033395 RepID=A0ABT5XGT2_9EURY|nr:HEAT repeat domain-containing protein [Candidatus Methanocrinis alkalitolerans]MCR3883892.1 HEAT repeat domain-containing protein [Methanothrix sp.]MDF0593875.1 HEAT repeat domain-containing protein [Candidatus Methanocrinis alkalitolerans]
MAEGKKEKKTGEKEKPAAVPLGETEAIDALAGPQVPEDLPDATWTVERLAEVVAKEGNMLVRANAVNALAKKGGPEVVEPLVSALKDPEDVVKANAMVGLAALGRDLVQKRMADLLIDDEANEEMRGGAAWVLGEMMDEESLSILKKAAEEDTSPFVRVHAKASILAYEQAKAPGDKEVEKK